METTISKWGNGQGIRIPKAFMETMELDVGEEVNMKLEDDKLTIEKSLTKGGKVAKMFCGYEKKAVSPAVQWELAEETAVKTRPQWKKAIGHIKVKMPDYPSAGDIVDYGENKQGHLLVISNNSFNSNTGKMIVCPIEKVGKSLYPTRVNIGDLGTVLCEQVRSMPVIAVDLDNIFDGIDFENPDNGSLNFKHISDDLLKQVITTVTTFIGE